MPRATSPVRSDAGFSLIESLVATALLLVITGSVFALANPGTETSQTQPEAMDMQQRARIAVDLLSRDMFMAGAGLYSGPSVGALSNYFAPIVPRKMGLQNADLYTVVRSDAITLMYVPNTYSQTTIRDAMPQPSAELKVNDMPNCPPGQQLCGFHDGETLLILDNQGHFDFFTVTNVQDNAGHLQHRQQDLSYAYQPGAYVTEAETHTYYLDAVNHQLRHYDGYMTDVSVVDNVVGLNFLYFGDPNPPTSPKPPVGIENCLYDTTGTLKPGLQVLTTQGGSLAPLPLSILNDGPWCGNGNNRFDADLLRVRKVRLQVRIQTGQAAFRAASAEFAVTGRSKSAQRYLPDYLLSLDVVPRNLNLGR
jgi:prepilin-type N-terminal cleavage/methylation domain-containing protein